MIKKQTIALFFGGLSNEAAVSVMSAHNVVKYFDYRRYQLRLVYWHKQDGRFYLLKNINDRELSIKKRLAVEDFSRCFDVALLMTHGRYGEDGVLQAVLASQGIKYCGCGVLSSALCMDKAALKNLLSGHNIPQVDYAVLDYEHQSERELKEIKNKFLKRVTWPIFVKPANSGSSVGISRVTRQRDLDLAILLARRHDQKVLLEQGLVNPREIEMGIIGWKKLLISRPGELKLAKEFYDYDDKYKLGQAQAVVPAKLTAGQKKRLESLAARVYRLADCRGFARLDFLLAGGRLYFSEVNTLPGFTDISMFPLLMMDRGLSYRQVLNKIIELAE